MSATLSDVPWPPTGTFLDSLQFRREDALLEYKRQWHDLQTQMGKAEFVKDVLAVANTVTETDPGMLVIGIDETETGSAIVGVSEMPSYETISQLLQTYTNPVPTCKVAHIQHARGTVSIVGIFWSPFNPHYAIRSVDKVLDANLVYCRRGPVVGILKPHELEMLIRQKDARIGPLLDADPIQIGFLDINPTNYDPMGTVVVRNVSDEPVSIVRTFLELTFLPDRTVCGRKVQIHSPMTFKPGESQEMKFRAQDLYVFVGDVAHHVTQPQNSAFDLTFIVQYRDRSGLIQERTALLRCASR